MQTNKDLKLTLSHAQFFPETSLEYSLFAEIQKRHEQENLDDLVLEILRDGSNTFGWWFDTERTYGEIVKDVCKKCKVENEKITDDINQNEIALLEKIVADYLDKLPEEKRKEFAKCADYPGSVIEDKNFCNGAANVGGLVGGTIAQICISQGAKFGLSFALREILSFGIPILNVIMTGTLIWGIASPAYRKIVPTVISVAFLRQILFKKPID